MYFAIQRYPNKTAHFFEIDGQDDFKTESDILKAIETWKSRITPRMAETIQLEIRHDN